MPINVAVTHVHANNSFRTAADPPLASLAAVMFATLHIGVIDLAAHGEARSRKAS